MSFSKRLEEARQAYAERNMQAAARAHSHDRIAEAVEEHGGTAHQYVGDVVYGGLDGIVTTFAVVSGVVGANLGSKVILILGLANLLADGFSMATGAYLSLKSEGEYYDKEWEREAWEVKHFPEGERAELLEIYRDRGYSADDAVKLVEIHSKDSELWTRAMMVDELGLMKDERKPLLSAGATFAAFLVAGALPLLVYLLGAVFPIAPGVAFPTAMVLSGVALFALGAAKVLVTGLHPVRSGLEMLVVGGLAGGVAYAVGALLKGIGG